MIDKRKEWEDSAQSYDRYEKKWHFFQNLSRILIEKMNIKKGSSVLDLACGTGACTKELIKKVGNKSKVVAVDFSPSMIEIAKRNLKRYKNVKFVISDVSYLDKIVKSKFDFVICGMAFWQFEDHEKVLRQVHKLLKKKGLFGFTLAFYRSSAAAEQEIFKKVAKKYKMKVKKLSPVFIPIDQFVKNKFKIKTWEIVSTPSPTVRRSIDFLKIPIMSRGYFYGNPNFEKRFKVFKEFYRRLAKTKSDRFSRIQCIILEKI